jgi:beta-glucanase (GH16 family)
MYKKLHILFCISLLLGACAMTTPEPAWQRAGWEIVWHDEFDGTELNLKNWTFDIGGNGWGNQELQAYTNRPENVRAKDGILVLEARQEDELIGGREYSSARIKTHGLQAWQ